MSKDIVVIGGGTAGARLARQLTRQTAPAATGAPGAPEAASSAAVTVTVIGEEEHAPYNRVLLAEVLAGRYGPEVIAQPATPVRRGVRVVRIDRAERVVQCDDGSVVPYGTLVLATGSNPVLPPLRGLGADLPDGVHPFRTMDDCLALAGGVREGTRAVVIGGGLLGVSAARALAERGAQVVLAQQGEHLMQRQLDPDASELLRGHLEALGVEIHTECRVRGLRCEAGEGAGTVRAVELADGYALDADLVVLACGVRPRVGLAQAAGLEVRQGIVVDDELRTSDPHIRAIGDCAEHNGRVYGLAGPALEQADILADLLLSASRATALDAPRTGHGAVAVPAGAPAGGPTVEASASSPRYTGTRALTRLTLTGVGARSTGAGPLDLAAFGETNPLPGDDVVRLADATRGAYRKVVVRGDRLIGGILLGDLGAVGELARTWEGDEPLPSTPLFHLLGGA
ncbi:nitrite reductase [Streptomyces agglomeratus]|uniref:Nitrite reductase n=1 Tax=Streptomyces agglomeratus TaxID=285458 RepID=A0A1E5PBX9_9ACTN|nr:FAD-dependent oxidoreductase [Streptomyces agglomeratus]OEJ26985.1 nitrite reductase [Streptomyces agglomeratus]OEJ38964.1 nitrite reductase [Streptomyces agglomeratus]OEJ46653.1 nitrite reductase [Streptomyces agglomeratus]OEJ51494.1 nitrite reductase [Streptomyces agglomeratus]OEJ58895.1 nitrite reductase [Streptomyces agglomeratus]